MIWCHPDKKHYYHQVKSETGKFMLCQNGGSLSSIKCYESEAEAREDGWYIWKGVL